MVGRPLPQSIRGHDIGHPKLECAQAGPDETQRRRCWDERYLSGSTPWDTGITPPQVVTFWESGLLAPNGLALDLGCGSAANASFLAAMGMHVVAVDLSAIGLSKARVRIAKRLGRRAHLITLVQADVTMLPVAGAGASYILDIGCLHSLPRSQRTLYARGVVDNLLPGGFYHLFAFDHIDDKGMEPEENARGLGEDEACRLFTPSLTLLTVVRGQPDQRPCRWYLLRKNSQ